MKHWVSIIACSLILSGCATTPRTDVGVRNQTSDILASELTRLDAEFRKNHDELLARIKELPKSDKTAEALRCAMASARNHNNYVALSKKMSELHDGEETAPSQNQPPEGTR